MEKNQRNIVPKYYEIYIKPYLEDEPDKIFKFEGNVTIRFNVLKATKTIILHSKDLTIDQILVTYQSTHRVQPLKSASQLSENAEKENGTASDTGIGDDTSGNTTEKSPEEKVPTEMPVTELPKEKEIVKEEEKNNKEVEPTEKPNEDKPVIEMTSSTEAPKSIEPEITSSKKPDTPKEEATSAPDIKGRILEDEPASNDSIPESSEPSKTAPEIIDASENTFLLKSRLWKGVNKLRIEFDDERLLTGINYTIQIKFSGILADRYGLVKSGYFNEETKNKR